MAKRKLFAGNLVPSRIQGVGQNRAPIIQQPYGITLDKKGLSFDTGGAEITIDPKAVIEGAGNIIKAGKNALGSGNIPRPKKKNIKVKFKGESEMNKGYALTNAPKPTGIEFKSGIRPNMYVSDYMQAIYNRCVPMHITFCKIYLPTSISTVLKDYFEKIIAFDVQTRAQANVSFNLNIGTILTSDKILSCVNTVVYALQVYYTYNSVLSYHSNPRNRNAGMLHLREQITADNLESLSRLARILLDTPVPPNFHSLVRFFCGNYMTGKMPTSPIIKFIPWWSSTGDIMEGSVIDQCIDDLSNPDFTEVYSLIRRAIPQWLPSKLPDIPTEPFYSEQFMTLWANAPSISYDSGAKIFKASNTSATIYEEIPYNSFTNELDGVIYAMNAVRNETTLQQEPGLLIPIWSSTETSTSRKSYAQAEDGSRYFMYAYLQEDICYSRPETVRTAFQTPGYLSTVVHLPGTDMCKGVSAASITETCYKALDYLMSLDTIRPGFNKIMKG